VDDILVFLWVPFIACVLLLVMYLPRSPKRKPRRAFDWRIAGGLALAQQLAFIAQTVFHLSWSWRMAIEAALALIAAILIARWWPERNREVIHKAETD
jgi:MFS family permease